MGDFLYICGMRKKRGYWTKERCHNEAKKYLTRNEFLKSCGSAHTRALKKGWLDEICSHMNSNSKPRGYWTKERCREEALKYSDKQVFTENNSSCISIIYKKGWAEELLSHIENKSNKCERIVYSYEFKDNCVYIGLTYNDKKRTDNHLKYDERSPVFKHIQKTGLIPTKKYITQSPVDENTAQIIESKTELEYKLNGWTILNTAKTGSLGGNKIKWDYNMCEQEALKYDCRSHFKKESPSAYQSAKNMGWLDVICQHMVYKKMPNGYWTKEKCLEFSKKCDTITEFKDKFGGAYAKSNRKGWIKEFFPNTAYKSSKLL
jgi:hypothetical protein